MSRLRNLVRAGAVVVALIAGYEGYSSLPYQDEAGVWTNGHGTTQGVGPATPPVTRAEAAEALKHDLSLFQQKIDICLTRVAPANTSAAFSSLAYNIGSTAFCGSTVVRRWNAGDARGACDAILMWDKLRQNGVLRQSRGLHNRRVAERDLCLKDI